MIESLTILALLLGPILAVCITRYIDNCREQKQRKMELFRALMQFRQWPLHTDYVSALNLIEVEFYQDEDVIKKWKVLYEHFNNFALQQDDKAHEEEFSNKRDKYTTQLIEEMAKNLGIKLEAMELYKSGYIPQYWQNLEYENNFIRQLAISLLKGETNLPVHISNLPVEIEIENDLHSPKTAPPDGRRGG